MAVWKEDRVPNSRGQSLYRVSCVPQQTPQAVVVWHHGIGEHIGRFKDVFERFADAGVAAYGFDAHGHGKSEPLEERGRAYIANWSDMVDDARQFVSAVQKQHQGVPMFMAGNSLGALVAVYVVMHNQRQWAGTVLLSPALDVEWTPMLRFQAAIGGLLAAIIPRKAIVDAVRPQDMSQDPAVVEDYVNDPLNTVGKLKASTARQCLLAYERLHGREGNITLPMYILHGTQDHCTSFKAAQEFFRLAGSSDKAFDAIEGGYHELLMGPEKMDIANRIVRWILSHAALANRSRI